MGIAIDETEGKVYWGDMREGIYFRIERADYDGENRENLYQGTHQKPYGLSVNSEFIYWTDLISNALWRMNKTGTRKPEKVTAFNEKPFGVLAKHLNLDSVSACNTLVRVSY